jgi:hypothetical protein
MCLNASVRVCRSTCGTVPWAKGAQRARQMSLPLTQCWSRRPHAPSSQSARTMRRPSRSRRPEAPLQASCHKRPLFWATESCQQSVVPRVTCYGAWLIIVLAGPSNLLSVLETSRGLVLSCRWFENSPEGADCHAGRMHARGAHCSASVCGKCRSATGVSDYRDHNWRSPGPIVHAGSYAPCQRRRKSHNECSLMLSERLLCVGPDDGASHLRMRSRPYQGTCSRESQLLASASLSVV